MMVESPAQLWRVHRRSVSPIAIPNWVGDPSEPRILYATNSPSAAVGQALLPFRPSPHLVRLLGGEWKGLGMNPYVIPFQWAEERVLSRINFRTQVELVDADDTRAHGLTSTGRARPLQGASLIRAIWESDRDGNFSGARTRSRFSPDWLLYGLFLDRLSVDLEVSTNDLVGSEALRAALQMLGLSLGAAAD